METEGQPTGADRSPEGHVTFPKSWSSHPRIVKLRESL